jgi:hypothetical protein
MKMLEALLHRMYPVRGAIAVRRVPSAAAKNARDMADRCEGGSAHECARIPDIEQYFVRRKHKNKMAIARYHED